MLKIRDFKSTDVEQLIPLVKKFIASTSRDEIEEGTDDSLATLLLGSISDVTAKIVVAERDGKLVGFASGKFIYIPFLKKPRRVKFESVYAESDSLNNVGKHLVVALYRWAKYMQCDYLEGEVYLKNDRAVKMWEQVGMKTISNVIRREID